jgi:hypothetical protein
LCFHGTRFDNCQLAITVQPVVARLGKLCSDALASTRHACATVTPHNNYIVDKYIARSSAHCLVVCVDELQVNLASERFRRQYNI